MRKIPLTILAICITIFLAACGQEQGGGNASQNEVDENATLLEIHATNFEFDQAEYVVKAGEPVTIQLSSDEGMHGINIQGLDVNIDGNGSKTITPSEPGEYTIFCSILCGTGHGNMISKLIVQ
ncbi:cupredoxin domain-containing protein [Radiobacillus sp. PE A8.2]|uniref:cupredoxin domain-containing protein n=1 Tax=Radiobacillus sp. PE A8.2 TaxID=3380349 RepID=UPI00388FE6B7